MSKEPTRQQLSSRLAYNAHTPAFLLRMQQRVSGARGAHDDDDGNFEDDEYEYDGSGRPPIPKRPAIPERPVDDMGSADEDDVDERPQVVVLKEGKHLSEREVEDERRKAKGLSPLPEPGARGDEAHISTSGSNKTERKPASATNQAQGLSFSSGAAPRTQSAKRKAVADGRDAEDVGGKGDKAGKSSKKKHKKAEKKLLSFGDEA